MGVLVKYAFMGEAPDEIAVEAGATIATLVEAVKGRGVNIPKGTVISLGGCEATMDLPLRTGDVVFFSKPVYEG